MEQPVTITKEMDDQDTTKFPNRLHTRPTRITFQSKMTDGMRRAGIAMSKIDRAFFQASEAMLGMAYDSNPFESLPPDAIVSITFTCCRADTIVEIRTRIPQLDNSEISVRLLCEMDGEVRPLPKP